MKITLNLNQKVYLIKESAAAWLADYSNRSTSVSSLVEHIYNQTSKNVPLLVVLVAATTLLATLVLRVHLVFAFIPEIGGIESNVIYSLQRILAGYPLYADPSQIPYSITQYTPLYYYLCWIVGKIALIDPDNVHHVYILSRSVSLTLNLLFSAVVFLVVRRVFRVHRLVSFVALAYAFVFLDEESFSRPDSLFNLLVIVTVGLFLKSITDERKLQSYYYLIGSSFLSVLTVFAKQSGVYLPVLILFFVVFYLNNRRWAVTALLTMALSFAALFALCSDGKFGVFLQNVVLGVSNGVDLRLFAERIVIEHFQKERFINILGLFIGFYYLAKGTDRVGKFLGLATLGSFVFALMTSIKIGAAPNYFTEFITLTIIGLATFISYVGNNGDAYQRRRLWSSHLRVFLLVFVLFTLPPRFVGKFVKKVIQIENAGEQNYRTSQAVADYLYKEELLQPNTQVFVMTHVEDYLNKFLYRNVVFPQKEIAVANPPGTYNYSSFEQALSTGTVAYVIADRTKEHMDSTSRRITKSYQFVEADFSMYEPIRQIDRYVIFRHISVANRR